MNRSVELAGVRLEHPVMSAAGMCKHTEDARKLARSASAAVMIGSITVLPREGNSGDVYRTERGFSLNSLGLPNPGKESYVKELPVMAELARGAGKPLIVSTAGFSPDENGQLTEVAFDNGADIVEVNLGCPNVWQGSEQKRIASFDPQLVAQTLEVVGEYVGLDAPVGVKLSPFSDPFLLTEIAEVLKASPVVKFVTAVNTFPNAFNFNGDGRPSITPGEGLAGMAGPALKPIGLGQVHQLRKLLPDSIQIIGVGGVTGGQDVIDYLRKGAVAVQVATAYVDRGEQVFSDILTELVDAEES